MCDPISIFSGISAAVSIFSALGGGGGGESQQPAIQPPSAPPKSQAAKTPEQSTFKQKIPAGDPTLLTGPGGVTQDLLNVGKATLLGS